MTPSESRSGSGRGLIADSSTSAAGGSERPPSAKRPRLAIVSDAASERNGVGAYYRDLSARLREHVDLELVSPDPDSGYRGKLSLPMPGDRTQRLVFPPRRRIARLADEFSPDWIVVPTPGPYARLGVRWARRSGARLAVGFHTHFERLASLYWNRVFARASLLYLESTHRALFREASAVLVNSGEMEEIAKPLGARRIVRVGTPLARDFVEAPVRSLGDAKLERVLFAGRLAPEKNVTAVVEAASELPEIRFSLAGDGPLRAGIEREAARLPNLECLGWLSRPELLEAIDACDLLVLPSSVESFGTAAFEAMVRERSVLVSANCGILDWPKLRPGLFDFGGEEPLADAICRIAALDPRERSERSLAARAGALAIDDENVAIWLALLSETE